MNIGTWIASTKHTLVCLLCVTYLMIEQVDSGLAKCLSRSFSLFFLKWQEGIALETQIRLLYKHQQTQYQLYRKHEF